VGETAADTAREVGALRDETERLLDALEGRTRQLLDVRQQAATHPALPVVAGVVAAAAGAVVLVLWYRSYRRAQEARRPINRLRRGLQAAGSEALPRAQMVGEALRGEDVAREHVEEEPQAQRQAIRGIVAGATLVGAAYLAKRLGEPQWRTVPPNPPPQGPPA